MKFKIQQSKTGKINSNFLGSIIGPVLGLLGGDGGNSAPAPAPVPPAKPPKDNTMLFVGIGGAVMIVVVLLVTMKK